MGVPQGWIRTNAEICESGFQVEICGGKVKFSILNIKILSFSFYWMSEKVTFLLCSTIFDFFKKSFRIGNQIF